MNKSNDKKKELFKYLHLYLSKKNINMKYVFIGIKTSLNQSNRMSIKQFNSIIRFLERETKFQNYNRSQIFDYFNSLIMCNQYPKEIVKYEPNTLSQFM